MSSYKPTSTFDKVFEGGILIKGATGVFEFLAGLFLLFVSPARIHDFLVVISQRELIEDPHDKFAHLGLVITHHISSSGGSRLFIILYLWLHAAVKLIAVIGILRNQLWAYPFSLITLGLLMLYQVYTLVFLKFSIGMLLLTIFDIFILYMIWREYGTAKIRLGHHQNESAEA